MALRGRVSSSPNKRAEVLKLGLLVLREADRKGEKDSRKDLPKAPNYCCRQDHGMRAATGAPE